MVRLPNTGVDPCAGAYLAAKDRRLVDSKSADQSQEALADHWSACLSYLRSSPVDWHKSGAVIWDHLDVELTPEWSGWTELMFGLARTDNATVRACQVALFGAFATSDGNVHLETIQNALATFIHAHPCFTTMVCEAEWHLPYGSNTLYRVGHQRSKATVRKNKRKHRR